jgi:hypothetical protein
MARSPTKIRLPLLFISLDAKAIRQGKLRLLPYILAWKMGWLSASAIRQKVFHYAFAGKSQPEILQRGNDHSQVFIPHTLRENAMQRIAWHQARAPWWWFQPRWMSIFDRGASSIILSCCAAKWNFKTGQRPESIRGRLQRPGQKVILANYSLADYEEIFAYGDTPEDFAMLALATTKLSLG